MAIYCMHCGTQVLDDSRFCPTCGQSPRGAAPAAPNQGNVPGNPPLTINTGATYGNTYEGTPPPYANPGYPPPGYPAPAQPSGQGAPQYSQYPQNPQNPQYAQNTQYAQPPQGTPFAPGMAPAQASKKNRLPLYIVAAIVVVIVIVGAVTYFNFINQPTPAKALSAFCNDLQTGDYPSSYTLLSSKYQKLATQTLWDTGLTTAFKALGGISSCTTSNVTSGSTTATGIMTLNYGNKSSETDKVSMVDENGAWKVDNITKQSSTPA